MLSPQSTSPLQKPAMEREMGGGRDQQLMLPISDASDEDKLTIVATATPPLSVSSASAGRKPRGRPPGSKNRPKPPVIITRESESAMHPVVLEIAAGCDIVDAVSAFSRRRRLGVSILSGSGGVINPSFHHHQAPASHTATTITFAGRFEILSIGGTFLPPAPTAERSAVPVTVSVAGSHGQVIGGQVAGMLTAAGPVVVVATIFGNAEFHRLPNQEEEEEEEEEKDQMKMKEENLVVGSSATGNMGAYNVGPSNMVLWPSRNPRAPPPHLLHPPPSLPPPPHY